MSKHFYFGATVFFILSIYVIEAMGVDVKSLLLVGFTFLLSMCGVILNELYEHRSRADVFQKRVHERLEVICFELQIMRDCRFDQMQERTNGLIQTIGLLSKITDGKEDKNKDEPTTDEGKKADSTGRHKR